MSKSLKLAFCESKFLRTVTKNPRNKNFLLLIYFLFSAIAISAQNNTITIGKSDSINSKIVDEKRKVWIHVPYIEERELYEKQKYPVVYVLDGEEGNFAFIKTMIEQLSLTNGNNLLPQMIVVGVQNTDRFRDLTPSHMDSHPTSGGGEKFIAFLEEELIPHIDSTYPTAPYRILIGHSLGGLTVLNVLIHHKELFNAYVAIDPSMWWDNQKLLKQVETTPYSGSFLEKSLFLGIANSSMEDEMGLIKAQKDTTFSTLLIRSNLSLAQYFERNERNELNVNWKYYPEEDHMSVPSIAAYDAFRFIFKNYNLKLKENNFFDPTINLVSVITEKHRSASSLLGYEIKPPGDIVHGLGNYMVILKQFDKAEKLFNLNVSNYPNSHKVYEALGDFYLVKGDTINSVQSFKKALKIKEDPDLKKKLLNIRLN